MLGASIKSKKWIAVAVMATVFGLGVANTSQAAFVYVGSRATLAGTDSLDWGTKGPAFTSLTNPFTITSTGSVVATVSQASGPMLRLDEGTGFNGHFALGDKLLYTNGINGSSGPLKILFGTALSGAGARMQTNFGGTFTALVEALAADGTTVLASFNYTGVGGSAGGANDASFAGISTTAGSQFFGLRISGVSGVTNPNDFAIDKFDFSLGQAPLTNAVPVPAGMILALSGLPALGFAGWVRRRFTTAA